MESDGVWRREDGRGAAREKAGVPDAMIGASVGRHGRIGEEGRERLVAYGYYQMFAAEGFQTAVEAGYKVAKFRKSAESISQVQNDLTWPWPVMSHARVDRDQIVTSCRWMGG